MNNQSYIKPEINKEHPRIKNRTPDEQKYRDDLAQVLKANRQLGNVGRQAARVVLENESKSPEYISAKENIPEDLAKDVLEYILHSEEPEDLKIDRILEKSKGVSHKKIAKLLIEKGNNHAVYALAENLEKFEGLDSEIAKLLIEKGNNHAVYTLAQNLEKFEGLDSEFAELLIKIWYWSDVAKNLEKFEGLDHKKIAELLIRKRQRYVIPKNLEKFEGLDSKIAELIIEKGPHRAVSALANNLEKFEGLNSETAKLLTEKGYWSVVINNLKKFEKLDSETVEILIKEVREAEQRKND